MSSPFESSRRRLVANARSATRSLPKRIVVAALTAMLILGGAASVVAASSAVATEQEARTIAQNSSAELTLQPDADGLPVGLTADVFASADLEEYVVDVYVDNVLVESELQPSTLSIEFEPSFVNRIVRIDVREFGEARECEVDGGSVQLQNITVKRVAVDDFDIPLLERQAWTVAADSSAEIANVAAIGTLANGNGSFRITEDAPVTVRVGEGADFASSQALWDELSGDPLARPGIGERLVVNKTGGLSTTGGSVFISESEFGGRVGSVQLNVDIRFTPQANHESGFALRINERIVGTGIISADGHASFDVVIDEESWPRDVTVSLDLSLVETESACADDRPFSGQVEVTAEPIGDFGSTLSVSDFPAVLLEGSPTLFTEDGVSDHDVAVVGSALQAVSAKRIVVADADERAAADVVIERGAVGSVAVEGNQLIVTLTDETVELLQQERFWVFNASTIVGEDGMEAIPDELALVDLDGQPGGSNGVPLYLLIVLALAGCLILGFLGMRWKKAS